MKHPDVVHSFDSLRDWYFRRKFAPPHSQFLGAFVLLATVVLVWTAECQDAGREKLLTARSAQGNLLSSQALLPDADSGDRTKLFTKLDPADTGVTFTNPLADGHPLERIYHGGFACGAAAMGDFNSDSKVDLFFTGGPVANALYLQGKEALAFEDVTAAAGVGGGGVWTTGVAVVDIDADGDLDIYTCNYDAPNQLFVNDGAARFEERAAAAGLDLVDACLQPAFADYDRDGDLDLFVLTNQYFRDGGRPRHPPVEMGGDGKVRMKPEYEKFYAITEASPGNFQVDDAGRPDILLRNESEAGQGLLKFVPVSEVAGITHRGFGLSVQWWDFDGRWMARPFCGQRFQRPRLPLPQPGRWHISERGAEHPASHQLVYHGF